MKKNIGNGSHLEMRAGEPPRYRNGLAYLLIGGGIGATLALLFAPKAGTELRSGIADVTRKGYGAALDTAKDLNKRSGDLARTVKQKAGAAYGFAAEKAGLTAFDQSGTRVGSAADGSADGETGKSEKAFDGISVNG